MISINHKLYPTKKQELFLDECLWSAIGIENWAISQIRNSHEYGFPLAYMKPVQIRSILSKRIEKHSKRCDLPCKLINDCIAAVCETVKRHGIWKTKFKNYRQKKSFYFVGDIGIKPNGRLKLPKLKTTLKMSEMNKFDAKLCKVTLIRKVDGWFACCVYKIDRPKIECVGADIAGIDPGLADKQLVLSDGSVHKFPRFRKIEEEKIAKLQRKTKGSKKLRRLQAKVAARRKDHHHKLSTDIARKFKEIYWSDDNFANLKQCLKLGKTYSDVGLGSFRDLLQFKLSSRTDGLGRLVKISNKFSTQTCSSCGEISFKRSVSEAENKLAVRNWTCICCGAEHDRDLNAAINTLISGRGATSIEGNHISR